MMALHLSGVVFRRKWKPPRLKPWEGPFQTRRSRNSGFACHQPRLIVTPKRCAERATTFRCQCSNLRCRCQNQAIKTEYGRRRHRPR